MHLETTRLLLEPFTPRHLDGLNALDRDPEVMRFIGPAKSLEETRAGIARVAKRWARLGYGWWAILEKPSGAIIGAACVQDMANIPGQPLEVGWRLAPSAQGKGYAVEAGQAALDFAFGHLNAEFVLAVADQKNLASHKVMERLGMRFRGIEMHYDTLMTTYVRHAAIHAATQTECP